MGVSATHLDWTMIPYVRKSFYKHYCDGLKFIESIKASKKIELALNKEEIKDISIKNTKIYSHLDAYNYAMEMTERECQQASEGLFHNLNTLQSRSGNQLPFTSINLGSCTLPEGRMITKSILNACLKGVGKLHKTSVFPCLIFQSGKGINQKPEDPNYDLYQLALKCTAKRLYPNYANLDWSGNAGYDKNDPRTYFSTINNTVA